MDDLGGFPHIFGLTPKNYAPPQQTHQLEAVDFLLSNGVLPHLFFGVFWTTKTTTHFFESTPWKINMEPTKHPI